MIVRLKHVKRVRAKGRLYFYHRITGERLPEDREDRARRVLDINAGLKKPSRRVRVGSVEALVNLYRGSPEFKNLRPTASTVRMSPPRFIDDCANLVA